MKIISQRYIGDGQFMLQLGGLSSETKPTDAFVATGSQFFEDDTDAVFTFSGLTWNLEKNGQMKDLPVVTATDNGKVLKVANGVWSVGEAGGSSGGGAEKFVVNISERGGITSDKTIAEIVAAKEAGKDVVANVYIGMLGVTAECPLIYAFAAPEGQGFAVVFSAPVPNMGESIVENIYTVYGIVQSGSDDTWDSDRVSVGGSSNAPLIVTLTYDSSTSNLVGDKTHKEIYDAFSAGRSVLCKGVVGSTNVSASVLAANDTSGEEYTLSVCVNGSIKTPEGTASDYLTIHVDG